MTEPEARSLMAAVAIDLNVRCSDHDSTTYAALEDVTGGSVYPGAVVVCHEPESRVRGLGVVKHVDHERSLVYINIDFRSLRDASQ